MSLPINIKNLSFNFDQNHPIFENLSLKIPTTSFSLLTGPSGAGKSTFLKLLAGLYPLYGGSLINGSIYNLPKSWGMIFQDPDKQFTMATPREEFVFTLENLKLDHQEAQKRITDAITQTHITDLLDQKFTSLSGGEKQRVAFALMLAMRPGLLLLDEPFANCDPTNRNFLIDQLAQLKKSKITIILSDHNFSHYKNLVDQVYLCKNKHISLIDSHRLFIETTPKLHLKQNSASTTPIFKLKNFSLFTPSRVLIQPSNLSLYTGTTLLTGTNGSGKTSFFKALTKMSSYKGQIFFKNSNINKIKNKKYLTNVGQAFQNPDNQFFMVTVGQELEFSLKHCHNPFLRHKNLSELLRLIDLAHHQDQVVHSLSGGQKKKLQLLLMLMANPSYLLLDEPLAGVDQSGQTQIIYLLQNYYLNQLDEAKGIILISHQLSNLTNFFDYHLTIQDQQLIYLKGSNEYES